MKQKITILVFQTAILLLIVSSILFSQDKIRVACVGNSITDGNMLASKSDAYPSALQRYMGSGYDVRNFGLSGTTMLKKGDYPLWNVQLFRDAVAFNANIVIIELGTNDTKPQNWVHKDEFMQDYYAMIDIFRNCPAHPEVYVCYPLPSFSDAFDIRDSIIVNDVLPIMHQIVDSVHVKPIDLNTYFLDKSNLMLDGIHPNIEGNDVMAKFILKAITGITIETLKENNVGLNAKIYSGSTLVPELSDGDLSTGALLRPAVDPVTINLGSKQSIDMMRFLFVDTTADYIGYLIEFSDDSIMWTAVPDTSIMDTISLTENTATNATLLFHPVNAKYLRFKTTPLMGLPDSLESMINEIKIFGTRPVHAPVLGWSFVSQSSSSIRIQSFIQRTSNIGEYVKVYRKLNLTDPFTIAFNYGSQLPSSITSNIRFGNSIQYYGAAYFNGFEIISDTLTITGTKITDVETGMNSAVPCSYDLLQNYPNPFNPETNIEFTVGKPGQVRIDIFDLTGRLINTVTDKPYTTGIHKVLWNGKNSNGTPSASGVYYYQLKTTGEISPVKKMILLR